MSKSFLSIESTELEAGSLEPQRQCNAHRGFDLFCIRFGRTARAVRDFVTCSSPQSSGFMEDNTTASQEYSSPIEDDLDETPTSTTEMVAMQPSVPQALPKPVITRDVWSIRNGISPTHDEFARHQSDSSKVKARHPGHCHQRTTFAQVSMPTCRTISSTSGTRYYFRHKAGCDSCPMVRFLSKSVEIRSTVFDWEIVDNGGEIGAEIASSIWAHSGGSGSYKLSCRQMLKRMLSVIAGLAVWKWPRRQRVGLSCPLTTSSSQLSNVFALWSM